MPIHPFIAGVSDPLLDLVFPTRCAGCGVSGRDACVRCIAALGPVRRHRPAPLPDGFPPTWVAADYAGATRELLLAYKERGRRRLARSLGTALGAAVAAAVEYLLARSIRPAADRPSPRRLYLAPIPSRSAVARSRGGDHVRRLAAGALESLGRDPALIVPALRVAGRSADSVGLSAAERAAVRSGGFGPGPAAGWVAGAQVVIVDDLVTTGATLADAARVLREAGAAGVAAAAIGATQRRHRP